jgi:acetoin:2,6-dichlorophenolindophenol oxidoreductase subunit alpha
MTHAEAMDGLDLYRAMLTIRRFEETALSLRLEGRIYGTMHPYVGQEAIATGVSAALRPGDRIVSNHRGHGHLISRGADLGRMMAELFGRTDGYSRGKGGSMHIADFDLGILGANGIVGAGLPIAVGSGMAAQILGDDSVTVAFFGDGATGEGTFHEALNIAALEKLPVVWVCENNQYADRTRAMAELPTGDVVSFAGGYGIPGVVADGTDVGAVRAAASEAIDLARRGGGPTLVECRAFRHGVHAQRGTPIEDVRPAEERSTWLARDPIARLGAELMAADDRNAGALSLIRAEVEERLVAAVAFAENSPYPSPDESLRGVFA